MRLLILSAIRNAKHFTLALLTLFTLLCLTVANQMEMFALGMMANTGVDFFTLFGKEEKGQVYASDAISIDDIEQAWKDIDKKDTGVITKKDAISYMGKRKDASPLSRISRAIYSKLGMSVSFQSLICILVGIAFIKALFLSCPFIDKMWPICGLLLGEWCYKKISACGGGVLTLK